MKPSHHPDYVANITDWAKYRATLASGKAFVDSYLKQYSTKESTVDYALRKDISYCPAHAKSALLEVKDSIYQKMADIIRKTGCKEYNAAVTGQGKGIDLCGNTMNNFIGSKILEELLALGKVGVFIDRQKIQDNATLVESKGSLPYLYMYHAEEILSWSYDENGQLKRILLEDTILINDEETGLPTSEEVQYRLLVKTETGIDVLFYDGDGKEVPNSRMLLKLKQIPFVIFEISNSLLTDIADYQIAHLNLASSDMNYAFRSNFPFYTEQYSALTDNAAKQAAGDDDVKTNLEVGVSQGRRYPKGLERPGFIHPSAEPLRASMEKQDNLKLEIRTLIHLAVTNVTPGRASAESKTADQRGLEAGLGNIGLELEYGERQIAMIYCDYLGVKSDNTVITYPRRYDLRTDEDYSNEADRLSNMMIKSPSKTYQKVIAKKIARLTVGREITIEQMTKIEKEIDEAATVIVDPEILLKDIEASLVSEETASKLRGYPKGEVEKARKDHAERAVRVAAAQSKAGITAANPGARGTKDLDPTGTGPKDEKNLAELENTK